MIQLILKKVRMDHQKIINNLCMILNHLCVERYIFLIFKQILSLTCILLDYCPIRLYTSVRTKKIKRSYVKLSLSKYYLTI